MKIIALLASPHKLKGNTAGLMNFVIEGAQKAGAETEIICLDGHNVQACNGCDVCHRNGACAQKDAFEEIKAKIEQADGVILGSPNYIFSVSAQLKAFMDRCCGIVHCLSFEGKYGASVVTSGGGGDDPIIQYMNRFLLVTGIHPIGGVHATMAALPNGEFTEGIKNRARELGADLVAAWREKRTDPEVTMEMNAFRKRMRELVFWKKEEWLYEYNLWQNRGEEHDSAPA